MRLILIALAALLLNACGLLYRQDVQQGNLFEEDQLETLKPGMTKRQVVLILGSPALQSPFREDRWDYVSSTKIDGKFETKRLTLYFDGNLLARIEGDYDLDGKSEDSNKDS